MTDNNKSQARMLRLLEQVGEVVADGRDIDATLSETVALIQSIVGVNRCSILLLNPEGDTLTMVAATDIPREEWSAIQIPIGKGFAGKVAQTGEPILVENTNELDGFKPSEHASYQINSFVCVPLVEQSQVIGVINLNDKHDGTSFDRQDLSTINTLSRFISMALANTRLLIESNTIKQNLKNVMDGLFNGICTVQPDGRVREINAFARGMFNLGDREIRDEYLQDLLPAVLSAPLNELINETIELRVPMSRQVEVVCPEIDRTYLLGLTTTIILDELQELDSIVLILDDHSVYNEVAKLRQMDEVKNNFIAMVSHELRTPLTSIKGAVYMLETALSTDLSAPQNQMVKLISDNTNRLIREINNMLDVTHIENKTIMLVQQLSNLHSLITKLLPKMEKIATLKNITLEYKNEDESIDIDLDLDKFSKVIENLLDNAIKFTKIEGRVWLTVKREGNMCLISVIDSGIGIPVANQQQIFDKFYQAEHTMTREAGGCGLGLYISRAMVEKHGGSLKLMKSSSAGSEFEIRVPVAEKE